MRPASMILGLLLSTAMASLAALLFWNYDVAVEQEQGRVTSKGRQR